jgi:hypothetical protein
MKKLVVAASAALLLAMSSLAALADEVTGAIQDIDDTAMTVTLDDGNVYKLPDNLDVSDFEIGDEVTLEYTKDANGDLVVSDMQPAD